jgi:hypothetical protein
MGLTFNTFGSGASMLDDDTDVQGAEPRRANTPTVLVMLSAAAITFSYLWAYALTDALVKNGLLSPWQPGPDPRPGRMLVSFVLLLSLFTVGATAARVLSKRQMRGMEQMGDEVA